MTQDARPRGGGNKASPEHSLHETALNDLPILAKQNTRRPPPLVTVETDYLLEGVFFI